MSSKKKQKRVAANVDDEFGENVDISIQPQNRIIVRNADMVIESNHPVAPLPLSITSRSR